MQTNVPQQIQQGFILSRQVQDKGNDLQITLWLKTEKGAKKLVINNELAVFFVEQPQASHAETILQQQGIALVKQKPLALKTFGQQYVHGFYFANLSQFYRARECLKANKIKCYEDDIRPDDRYLMERFITADVDFLSSSKSNIDQTNNDLS